MKSGRTRGTREETRRQGTGERIAELAQTMPFDARAFPLTSFEMQCSSLRLNEGIRLFNFLLSAAGSE